MMHRTRSLDYALVMSGEIDMMLDEDTVHLKAGDVVVQQATNHAWINRGKVPARVAFILIDSQEPYLMSPAHSCRRLSLSANVELG